MGAGRFIARFRYFLLIPERLHAGAQRALCPQQLLLLLAHLGDLLLQPVDLAQSQFFSVALEHRYDAYERDCLDDE